MAPQISPLAPANCDVLLLSAGFGKRMKTLTASMPKPMLKVQERPLIDWNLELLARAGFKRAVINLHYLGGRIEEFVQNGARWGIAVEYSREPVLLDTGGGIKNVEHRLRSQSLVTVNSDALLGRDFNYQALLDAHAAAGPDCMATLAVREDPGADRYGLLQIDPAGRIVSFLDADVPGLQAGVAASGKTTAVMYAGVQVVSRKAFAEMPPAGSIFSITKDTYRTIIRKGGLLASYKFDGYWSDVGTPERLEAASKEFAAAG